MSDRLQRMMQGLAEKPPRVLRSPLWPRQKCKIAYCPDLEAKPFHDPARFPWIKDFEASYPSMRAEIDALVEERASFLKAGKDSHDGNVTEGGAWSSFQLFVHGRPVLENHARCPETVRAIRSIPDLAGLVGIMALSPGAHVVPHYALTNMKLRIHLGLRVPEECGMRIDTEVRRWQEGKVLVLDDSFQHEVWNASTNATRYILLLDFLHPDLTEDEKRIVRAYETEQGEHAWQHYAPTPGDPVWRAER